MATLRDIKNRITGVKKTQQITNALKMVSAVKLRRAQQRIVQARPYAARLNKLMGHIADKIDNNLHPLLAIRAPERICYLIVSSDQGLCGSFNHNIIRTADKEISENNENEIHLILIGRKAKEYFYKKEYNIISDFTNIFKDIQLSQAGDISKLANDLYTEEKLDRIYVIYNEFKTAAKQDVVIEQLLPIIPQKINEQNESDDFIFEPDAISILDTLCLKHINVQILRMLLESNASELGAKMTAMEYATENANKLINELTMQYNRIRQESITTEILEIVSGSEALRNK